jgi:hypothetical protein
LGRYEHVLINTNIASEGTKKNCFGGKIMEIETLCSFGKLQSGTRLTSSDCELVGLDVCDKSLASEVRVMVRELFYSYLTLRDHFYAIQPEHVW